MANINATAPNAKTRKPKKAIPSRKKAIDDMCKQCVYDKKATGTWREQVQNCCGYTCPLYELRPMPTTADEKTEE